MTTLVVDDDGQLRNALTVQSAAIYLESRDSKSLELGIRDPEVSSLVIGPMAGDPLSVAQKIARLDERLSVLIVPKQDKHTGIRRQQLFTPFLGNDVRILDEGESRSLDAHVHQACLRTIARRNFQKKLRTTIEPERAIWRPEDKFILNTLLEEAPIGMAVIDPGGQIRTWNRYLEQLSGLGAAEAIGLGSAMPAQLETAQPLIDTILEVAAGGGDRELCLSGTKEHADPVYLLISERTLQGRSGPPGSLVMILDVSDRVRAQQQRLDAERHHADQQRLESLGVLAGGIAHDFNNVLAAILGNAEVGLTQLPSDHALCVQLREIISATQQAAELTRQMLSYAGQSSVEMEVRNLNTIISETCKLLYASISKNARLRLTLSEEALLAEMDLPQIRQVLMNLVTNASDAIGDKQGSIDISTDVFNLEGSLKKAYTGANLPPGRYARLRIKDSGSGMSPETQRKIFDPFFTTKALGRGLGLSAVIGILGSHAGGLSLETSVGHGTTFTVLLPLAQRPESQISTNRTEQLAVAPAGARVLIVDDEPKVRSMAARSLRGLGYEVETADDGRSGLSKLLTGIKVHAVLLDHSMPGLTGVQFMRELKARGLQIPIVLCTGHANTNRKALDEFENLRSVLEKPYSLIDLSEQVLEAVNSSGANGPEERDQ
jgi:PAS domain S-box-containing protein